MSERPNEPSEVAPGPDDAASEPLAAHEDAVSAARSSIGRSRASSRPSGGGSKLGWIALTVVVLLAAVAASPWWAPALAPLLPWSAAPEMAESGQGQPRIEERLAAVEQAVTQLRQGVGQNPAGGNEDLAPLRAEIQRQGAEIAKLSDSVAALDKQLAARPAADPAVLSDLQANLGKLGTALAELDNRVAKLASAAETTGARTDQALLLSLGQLRQAMQGSGPFAAEHGAALALAQERPDIAAALEPLAEPAARGLPSLAVLRHRFAGLAGTISAAGTQPAATDDWSEQILGKLRGLVMVRRVAPGGGAEGSAEAAVATAESALASDDLAGAVAALETLHGPAMLAAKDWLDAARRRLAAQAALDKATALVTARLAADRPPAASASAQGAKP